MIQIKPALPNQNFFTPSNYSNKLELSSLTKKKYAVIMRVNNTHINIQYPQL